MLHDSLECRISQCTGEPEVCSIPCSVYPMPPLVRFFQPPNPHPCRVCESWSILLHPPHHDPPQYHQTSASSTVSNRIMPKGDTRPTGPQKPIHRPCMQMTHRTPKVHACR